MNRWMLRSLASLAAVGLWSASVPGVAQVFKWVDDRGVTHYAERPPGRFAAKPATRLDIPLVGNDLPTASRVCSTIRCQYERLRQDRIVREAQLREEDESLARIAAARTPEPPAPAPGDTDPGWFAPGYPIYYHPRRAMHSAPRPIRDEPAVAEPRVRIRGASGRR
ncbi:MAG: DUF4124 domain-containing protein [Betaproteobacteria bacterium]